MEELTYENWFDWAKKRETLSPDDAEFYAYTEAWERAIGLVGSLQEWLSELNFKLLLYNVTLHYVCTAPYTNLDGSINPLYLKYGIADKQGGIVSSASDESSSASYHITKSLNDADFTTQDLMMTTYGQYAYSILEQLNVMPTLL